ncbi:UNVERIFIED_CONTAM: hypothetical protein FKN15_067921 [Acipenser sinensis]
MSKIKNPKRKRTSEIIMMQIWQGCWKSGRFVVGSNRAIFMLRDGGYAWEIKDFLVNQERCADVTVEGQVFPGKGAEKKGKQGEKNQNEINPDKKKKKKKEESKESKSNKESNKDNKNKVEL